MRGQKYLKQMKKGVNCIENILSENWYKMLKFC